MAEDPKTQKRVLLPRLYGGRNQFKLNGQASGQFGAVARCSADLEAYPHWVLGLRITNVYKMEAAGATLADFANMKTAGIDEMQEVRAVLGTYEIHDWIAQRNVVGRDGTHFHPFPMRMAIRGNVNLVVEVRRLTGYPFDIVPEADIALVTASVRAGRPGDIWDIDVIA